MIKLKKIDPESPEFRNLVDESNKLMYELYDKYILGEGDSLDAYLDDYTVLRDQGAFCVGAY